MIYHRMGCILEMEVREIKNMIFLFNVIFSQISRRLHLVWASGAFINISAGQTDL